MSGSSQVAIDDVVAGVNAVTTELLTPRERQVAILIAADKTSKEIATLLGCGDKTVKVHRTRISQKLDVGVAGVTRYVIRRGWIAP